MNNPKLSRIGQAANVRAPIKKRVRSRTQKLRRRMAAVIDQYLALDDALRKADHGPFRVCIFGSARIKPDDSLYALVHDLARRVAAMGADVVTGGGPGLMEAANKGLRDAGRTRARSWGLPLDIPLLLEPANAHLDIKSMHRRFSSRLDEFMRLSHAVVVAPGGVGTLLELYYVWQLLQLGMVEQRLVLLMGSRFWSGLLDWMQAEPLARGLISEKDLGCIRVVDTVEEAAALLRAEMDAFRAARRRAPTQPRQSGRSRAAQH